ncbi:carbohydrate ABC transporter permease [Cohnella cholangitidis]|uniref:carbohydrate ABC transporter permease n=1 Tax=Cohnella cholangitidis TaxID=2598458 RepID=UPI002D21DD9F|nr:sugar ABC transporter permease [Cohnella cholangitidis]
MSRHRKTATTLSIVGMGLGQLYNRQLVKGILLLLLEITGLYFTIAALPKALWGLITLGEAADRLEKVGRVYVNVRGDHSIFLMVKGIIALLAFLVFVYFYAVNIRDAYRVGKLRDEGGSANGIGRTVKAIMEERFPLLVLSVPMLLIVFFTAMPILFMILLAFTNFSFPNFLPPAKLVDWTGFKSFVDMFNVKAWSGTFVGVTVWTLVWMASATITVFLGGFAVALLVQMRGIRFKGFWRTLFIIPYAIPQFISLLIMKNMFNGQFGPINQYLSYFGLGKLPWLTDPFWAKVTVIVVNVWIGFPITMLMIIGILSTISKDLYEAAEMDGASGYQQFKAITARRSCTRSARFSSCLSRGISTTLT